MKGALRCALLWALLSAGCGAELGPADEAAAREVVYDGAGTPAFAGQALMIRSCGYGAFCHAEGVDDAHRFGAPTGLDFDLRVAGDDGEAERARLAAGLDTAFAHRHVLWESVASGAMPIAGERGAAVADGAPAFDRVDATTGARTRLPDLDTEEGREILRNWLAAGLPVVERTDTQPGEGPLGWIVERLPIEPLEPRWSDIYARLIEPRCASAACHGAAAEAGLDLRGEAESLARLLDAPAAGSACGPFGGVLLVPGDPDASLLVAKLTGGACGLRMPVGGSRVDAASIDAIRAWVAAGAHEG